MYGVYVNMCGVVYVQDCIRLYRLCCGVIHIFFMGVVLVRAAGIVFSHRYWWLGLGLCGEVLPGWCGYVGTGYECCDFWCPWNVLFSCFVFCLVIVAVVPISVWGELCILWAWVLCCGVVGIGSVVCCNVVCVSGVCGYVISGWCVCEWVMCPVL